MDKMEGQQKKVPLAFLPTINPKSQWTTHSYTKSVHEAPYRALVGVVIDEKTMEKHRETPRYRVRTQTGLTNRWRLPRSLYSDMLGTSQALKAVNLPFDHSLVSSFVESYPSMNPMLLMCQDFPEVNERNWSLLKTNCVYKPSTEEEDGENHLPPV